MKYPIGPLIDAMGVTDRLAMEILGMSGTYRTRYRRSGLTVDEAERYAHRAGLHPYEVWPDMALEVAREAAKADQANTTPCEECGEPFIPSRKGHRFCSTPCARRKFYRERNRERYQTDPEFRQREIERTRAYRAKAKRAIAIQQAQYRREHADELRAAARRWYLANHERELAKQRVRDRAKAAKRRAA